MKRLICRDAWKLHFVILHQSYLFQEKKKRILEFDYERRNILSDSASFD